jgi:hypothetical protein
MAQLSLEDPEVLKREGMERAARTSPDWLSWARREAVKISCKTGSVSAVDIRKLCHEHDLWPQSDNAWGSLFRGKQWEHVGWTQAKHAEGHARDVKAWKYVSTNAHLR